MELKLVHSGDFSSFLFSFDDLYSSGAESFDSVAVDECFCSFSLYVYWNTCGLCQYSRLLVSSFSLLFVDLMAISPILIIIPISSVCSIANPSHSHRRDCAACKYFIKYSYFFFHFIRNRNGNVENCSRGANVLRPNGCPVQSAWHSSIGCFCSFSYYVLTFFVGILSFEIWEKNSFVHQRHTIIARHPREQTSNPLCPLTSCKIDRDKLMTIGRTSSFSVKMWKRCGKTIDTPSTTVRW